MTHDARRGGRAAIEFGSFLGVMCEELTSDLTMMQCCHLETAIVCCAISILSFTFVFAVLDSTHCQYLDCVCACDRSKAILGDSLHIDLEWPKVVFANIDLEWPDSFICFISESSPPYHI